MLCIWRDLNQDGISQAEELTSLTDNNITAIHLTATNTNINLGNGNDYLAAGEGSDIYVLGKDFVGRISYLRNPPNQQSINDEAYALQLIA